MDKVAVETAKMVGKQHKAVGCIVLCIDENGAMNGASYGTNKHNCGQMGTFMDTIFAGYKHGHIRKPEFREGPRSKFPR